MAILFSPGTRVKRSDGLPATVVQFSRGLYELAYDEGGTGWWPEDSIDWLIVPRWVQFGTALMVDPAVNQMLGTVFQNAPGLYGGLIIGLQQAADGDYRAFLSAWTACRQMGLIDEELASSVHDMALAHDLPGDFVAPLSASLTPPEPENPV